MLGVRIPPGLPVAACHSGCELRNWKNVDGVKLMKESSKLQEFFARLGNKFREIRDFLKDTRKELNNVSWPGRQEVTGTTVVVIASVIFFGFFLYVVDVIVRTGMNYILNLK